MASGRAAGAAFALAFVAVGVLVLSLFAIEGRIADTMARAPDVWTLQQYQIMPSEDGQSAMRAGFRSDVIDRIAARLGGAVALGRMELRRSILAAGSERIPIDLIRADSD